MSEHLGEARCSGGRWRVRSLALGTAVLLGAFAGLTSEPMVLGGAEAATTSLGVLPTGWDTIALDAADPTLGPDRTDVPARVCNTGSNPALDVRVTWEWRSENA